MRFGMINGYVPAPNASRPEAYTRVQATLHWLVVILLIGQYSTSGAIVRTHTMHLIGQRQDPIDLTLHLLHNRVGLLLTVVMIVRLGYRLWAGAPPASPAADAFAARTAALVHAAFYVVLIVEGVTGAVASYLWWPASVGHVLLFKVLLGLIAAHLGAVLWHQFVLKDGTLARLTVGPFVRLPDPPAAAGPPPGRTQ